jgi:hypothetical protein
MDWKLTVRATNNSKIKVSLSTNQAYPFTTEISNVDFSSVRLMHVLEYLTGQI